MIECYDKPLKYKRRGKKLKKRRFLLVFLLIVILGLSAYYSFIITENVLDIVVDYCKAYATESVNKTVLNASFDDYRYEDLIVIEKNAQGEISLITSNANAINKINREIATKTSILLKEKLDAGIPVPLLAFSGIKLLSAYGEKVMIKTVSVTSVLCDFDSTFKSVGINQTLHSIYLDVEIVLNINLPLKKYTDTINSRVLLSETVIVGKVPEIYLNK